MVEADYDWSHYVRKWWMWGLEPSGRDGITEDITWLYKRASLGEPRVVVCEGIDHFIYAVWELMHNKSRKRAVESRLRLSVGPSGALAPIGGKGRKWKDPLGDAIRATFDSALVQSATHWIRSRAGSRDRNPPGVRMANLLRLHFRGFGLSDFTNYPFSSTFGAYSNMAHIAFSDFFLSESLIDARYLKDPFYECCQRLQDLSFHWFTGDQAVVLAKPRLHMDLRGRLHREDGPAVDWKGEGCYFLEDVRFDEELFKKVTGRQLSFAEVLRISNIEQRFVALKLMDPERFLSEAVLLDKSEKGNELYLIKGVFPRFREAFFLRYSCPSTGRVYVKGIHPNIGIAKNADLAQAWSFDLSLDEYLGLEAEA